ncbi:MAG: glycosyltransferase family 9 protein [Bdellovibrionales bacterium]|nr:glycosyltransferase family 9 protein [Bdellovibrionales bacterium]
MKILLIRFSSFGDVLQTLSVPGRLKEAFPQAEIHWVTRAEFKPLIDTHPAVARVWSLPKGTGLKALRALSRELRAEGFTHIYDAHNNLRSHLLGWMLNGFFAWRVWTGQHRFLRRSIYRFRRFLLFRFHKNFFPQPFSGQFALLEPLQKWGLDAVAPPPPQLFLSAVDSVRTKLPADFTSFVALAPSAAFELKRWPLAYWRRLIEEMPSTRFAVLGGPEDTFLRELENLAPQRVVCLAGTLSLNDSARVIALSDALVSNDTGLMHVAEQLGKPCVALMGPAPFGFPSRPLTKIMQLDLPCRPCSKHGQGPCVNMNFHQCLRGIAPEHVVRELKGILHA